ncbi:hypothetical protein DPMN_002723 [Dreissena polymorpha]|uniref:Uncharacterized protein n=1 Tax=Dreissena polymorpha TaxID=45954 RepID=A0A9D4MKL9_DREPO|nr:hypothetical protein DPMN_002723 [Dreissena polymorpha]
MGNADRWTTLYLQPESHDGVLASNLTVSNVEDRDAELEFMCIIVNGKCTCIFYSTYYFEGQTKVFTPLRR